jgi:hypothetical protein
VLFRGGFIPLKHSAVDETARRVLALAPFAESVVGKDRRARLQLINQSAIAVTARTDNEKPCIQHHVASYSAQLKGSSISRPSS